MSRRLISIFLLCIVGLALSGCCTCDQPRADYPESGRLSPNSNARVLSGDCAYIKEEIETSKSFAERMSNSRYAIYYQASSWERVSELEKHAKEMGCK